MWGSDFCQDFDQNPDRSLCKGNFLFGFGNESLHLPPLKIYEEAKSWNNKRRESASR